MRFSGIHTRAITMRVPKVPQRIKNWKIKLLKLLPHLPGTNQIMEASENILKDYFIFIYYSKYIYTGRTIQSGCSSMAPWKYTYKKITNIYTHKYRSYIKLPQIKDWIKTSPGWKYTWLVEIRTLICCQHDEVSYKIYNVHTKTSKARKVFNHIKVCNYVWNQLSI